MSIGMTYEQYWYGDVGLSKVFLEADRKRQERMNMEAWLQGMYFHDAVFCALQCLIPGGGKKEAYPTEPYKLGRREKKEDEKPQMDPEERERLLARLYLKQMEWEGKGWGRKIQEKK